MSVPLGGNCWLPGRVSLEFVGSFSCVEKLGDCLASCVKSESGHNSHLALIILVFNKAFPAPPDAIFLKFWRPALYLLIKGDLIFFICLQSGLGDHGQVTQARPSLSFLRFKTGMG